MCFSLATEFIVLVAILLVCLDIYIVIVSQEISLERSLRNCLIHTLPQGSEIIPIRYLSNLLFKIPSFAESTIFLFKLVLNYPYCWQIIFLISDTAPSLIYFYLLFLALVLWQGVCAFQLSDLGTLSILFPRLISSKYSCLCSHLSLLPFCTDLPLVNSVLSFPKE